MFKRLLDIAIGSGKKEIHYLKYANRQIFVIDLPPELSRTPGAIRVSRHAGSLYVAIEDLEVRPEKDLPYAQVQELETQLLSGGCSRM